MKPIFKKHHKHRLLLSMLIFLFISGLIACGDEPLETAVLSADTNIVYDINSDIPLDIETTPDDFVLSEDNFAVSGGEIVLDDESVYFSADKAGKYEICFEADEVKSNTLLIKIEDKKAIAKEKARKKAEEEARRKAEEEARIKAEEEARIKAEEEARIKAEQEARAAEELRLKNEREAAAAAQSQQQVQAPVSNEAMVWISETGSKYHNKPNCGRMNPDRAQKISVSSAESMGYEPCAKCY